jgi:LCCL domain
MWSSRLRGGLVGLVSALGLVLAGAGVAGADDVGGPVGFGPATPVAQALPVLGPGWSATAVSLRGRNGTRAAITCPPRGQTGSVWGSGVYTDDSSLCTAAVHGGFIALGGGGQVVIEIRGGLSSFPGSTRNGITSSDWGAWQGSFVVISASPPAPLPVSGPLPVSWSDNTSVLAGAGRTAIDCPAGGSAGPLWGSGLFTDDSSLCTAAVHAGVITFARGGRVDIELRPGQASYAATTSNGVTSTRWGAWSGSFVVVGGIAPPQPLQIVGTPAIDWSDGATAFRGRSGRIQLVCPPGGSPGTVWGDGPYTDDSSVCTAAVHAGLISTVSGGLVALTMVSGRSAYKSTTAHGVTTLSYGAWQGSFELHRP